MGVGRVWARFFSVGVGVGDNTIESVGVGWVWVQYEYMLWVWVGCGLKPVGVGRVWVQLSSLRRPLMCTVTYHLTSEHVYCYHLSIDVRT